MTVNARIVFGPRIVKVNSPNFAGADCTLERLDHSAQTILLSYVISGRKGMGGVQANTQSQFRTGVHDRAEMLETMSNAFTLARRVLQQDTKRTQFQSGARYLQALRAGGNTVGFAGAARASGMEHKIVGA